MCPSYMATREEAHSTRGRANVLRLAMSGRIGEAGLGDEGVRQVLDLCLECRACKAECPVGVDVARFKSEFLADYWRRHGTPIRAHMLGHISRRLAVGAAGSLPCRTPLSAARSYARSTSGCSGSIGAACRRHGRRGPSHGGFTSIAGGRALAPPRRSSTIRSPTFTHPISVWRDCRSSRSPGSRSSSHHSRAADGR